MTGYTVHTGSTEKFSTGWDHIFADKKKSVKRKSNKKQKAGTAKKSKKKQSG